MKKKGEKEGNHHPRTRPILLMTCFCSTFRKGPPYYLSKAFGLFLFLLPPHPPSFSVSHATPRGKVLDIFSPKITTVQKQKRYLPVYYML